MKCARCKHDSTYPNRSGRICPNCKGKFAFEPRDGDPVNDLTWQAALDWVSSNDTVRFTSSHLHHAVAHKLSVKATGGWFFGCGLVLATLVGGVLSLVFELYLIAAIVAGALAFLAVMSRLSKKVGLPLTLSESVFRNLHAKWVEAHGKPRMLIEPRASNAKGLTKPMEDELESYSFDRAVICDQKGTVDLLLANDFHFENNCAVITAGGYPQHAYPVVRKMLRKNPRLEVYVLHDATPYGCRLAHELRNDPEWFGGTDVTVFDVALRPGQAEMTPTLCWAVDLNVASHPALTESERAWLCTRKMELAAVRPEQIIKRLFRAMKRGAEASDTRSSSSSGSDGSTGVAAGVLYVDSDFTSDADASDGGGDSFG
jgi:hypothetical protein